MLCVLSSQGKYILATGKMSYSEEKLLQFFGQLLGVAIRADVPIALDLLPCFWKSLKGETLSLDDLREADCITYNLTKRMLKVCTVHETNSHTHTHTHTHTHITHNMLCELCMYIIGVQCAACHPIHV